MPQEQTTFFFCRHGETDKLYSIDPNVDDRRVLTEKGRSDIEKVGRYIAQFLPSAIYASPRRRTKETAEIVQRLTEHQTPITLRDELLEVYTDQDLAALSSRIPALFTELAQTHHGQHVVLVSHQDVIENGLRALGIAAQEADYPCRMGQLYRVVFAGTVFAHAVKLDPAQIES